MIMTRVPSPEDYPYTLRKEKNRHIFALSGAIDTTYL